MTRDWPRLATAIRAARESLGWRQIDLAQRAGVSESTVQNLEDESRTYSRMPHSAKAIEAAFGWPKGTVQSIAAGKEAPAPSPPADDGTTHRLASGIPARVEHELTHGRVMEASVVDLSDADSSGRLVMLWIGDDDVPQDKEALRREAERWTKVQRAAHGLSPEAD